MKILRILPYFLGVAAVVSLFAIPAQSWLMAQRESDRRIEVEHSHWHDVPAKLTAIGPLQGSTNWRAFYEIQIDYTDLNGEPASLKRLVDWSPNLTVGQPISMQISDQTGALQMPAFQTVFDGGHAMMFSIYLFFGVVLGLIAFLLLGAAATASEDWAQLRRMSPRRANRS